jgi:hypothetical protein
MTAKFSKSDRPFLRSVGIRTEPTLDEDRLELAKRIAKHSAPIQLKVDPQEAKRQLIRLFVKKSARRIRGAMTSRNRCRRANGTLRAWFATREEAEAFAADPANWPAYKNDIPVLCARLDCGGWHLSRRDWPDAILQTNAEVN